MRLWDSLLSDPAGRTDCLLRLCIAMLLHVRQDRFQVKRDWGACAQVGAGLSVPGWRAGDLL